MCVICDPYHANHGAAYMCEVLTVHFGRFHDDGFVDGIRSTISVVAEYQRDT